MLNVKINRSVKSVPAAHMEIGQIGIIKNGSTFIGKPVLRTYNNYALLSNANHTWERIPNFDVELLAPGDSITLQIEDANVGESIINFLREGRKIPAIKLYRERTGEGLMESKRYVDNLEITARADGRLPANHSCNW